MPHLLLMTRLHLMLPQVPLAQASPVFDSPPASPASSGDSPFCSQVHLRIWILLVPPQSLLAARINLRIWILLVPMTHRSSTICTNLCPSRENREIEALFEPTQLNTEPFTVTDINKQTGEYITIDINNDYEILYI